MCPFGILLITTVVRHSASAHSASRLCFADSSLPGSVGPLSACLYVLVCASRCAASFCAAATPARCAAKVSEKDLLDNKQVQCVAAEVLNVVMHQLVGLLLQHRHLRQRIREVCDRCKLQRVVLTCLAASVQLAVHEAAADGGGGFSDSKATFSDTEVRFNELVVERTVRNSFQAILLQLTLTLLQLDKHLETGRQMSAGLLSQSASMPRNTWQYVAQR